MKLSRKAYTRYGDEHPLVDREFTDGLVEPHPLNPFSLRIVGFDGREGEQSNSWYWYRMTFTQREMKIFLSRYLRLEKIPDNERKLLEVLLDLWEKRLKRRERRKRISN